MDQIDPFAKSVQKHLLRLTLASTAPSVESLDKSDSVSCYDFALKLASVHYLRKYEGSCNLVEQTPKAVEKFKLLEQQLSELNRTSFVCSPSKGAESIFFYAKRKILQIIGVRPNLDEFAEACDWGPGATSSLKGKDARLDKKILEPRLSVTPRALPYASAYLRYDHAWFHARDPKMNLLDHFKVVDSSRFTTVLKDMRGCRPIDIQPTMNLFLQKGVGKMLRKRLKREGIDLDDQSRNQELAMLAYANKMSTLDLASASDTLALELVRLLLPPKWFELMYDLRTDYTILPGGEKLRLQKFSAMGNGYTFELESLIFYALCWAVIRDEAGDFESEIAVYGDDIVVPRDKALRVMDALAYSGFTVNVEKSYVEGNYFESCGKHYFKGVEVTPPIQKEVVNSLRAAVRFSNRLTRWLLRLDLAGIGVDELAFICKSARDTAYSFLADANQKLAKPTFTLRKGSKKSSSVPRAKLKMPVGPLMLEGDDYLLSPTFPGFGPNGVYYGPRFSLRPVKVKASDPALFAHTLRKGVVCENPFLGFVPLRGRTRQLHLTKAKLWQSATQSNYVPKWWT